MDNCQLYFVVFGLLLVSEMMLLLNIHRIIKLPEAETVRPGGEVKPGPSRLQIIRLAMAGSIVMIIVVFFFLLSQQGCLA